jgi:uncharacterized membrane protein
MGEHEFAPVPTAVYACVLLAAALSYTVLVAALRRVPGQSETIRHASGIDRKGLVSLVIYAAAIVVALVAPLAAFGLYVIVACIWFVPDRQVERALGA